MIEMAILLLLILIVSSYGMSSSGQHIHCAIENASKTISPPAANAAQMRTSESSGIDCIALGAALPTPYPTPSRLGNEPKKP